MKEVGIQVNRKELEQKKVVAQEKVVKHKKVVVQEKLMGQKKMVRYCCGLAIILFLLPPIVYLGCEIFQF
jgi:hypothetical protein